MVEPKTVKLTDLEMEIRDYDDRILRECRRILYLYEHGETWLNIDKEIGFMDTLQAHRRGVLYAYRNAGGHVNNLHDFGAHAVATAEEEAAS